MPLRLPFDEVRRRVGLNKRRGKYAAHAFARQLVKHGWHCRVVPASSSGEMSEVYYFPDVEATYVIPGSDPPVGIYLAAEVKSSIRGYAYLSRPVQITKLWESMNLFELYGKRYAVLAAHFRKRWKILLLRGYHGKLSFIIVKEGDEFARSRNNRPVGKLFSNIQSLLTYMIEDKKVWFPIGTPAASEEQPEQKVREARTIVSDTSRPRLRTEKPKKKLDSMEEAYRESQETGADGVVSQMIREHVQDRSSKAVVLEKE